MNRHTPTLIEVLILFLVFAVFGLALCSMIGGCEGSVVGTVKAKQIEPAHTNWYYQSTDKGGVMTPVHIPETFYLHVQDAEGAMHKIEVGHQRYMDTKEGDPFDNRPTRSN